MKGAVRMASIKHKGNAFKVVYNYRTNDDELKQQWETYHTELEAKLRKVLIDDMQERKDHQGLLAEVIAYKEKMNALRIASGMKINANVPDAVKPKDKNNLDKTFADFIYKWFPFYERSKSNSVKTYDNKVSSLRAHIIPYFGHRIMSTITAEEYDEFIDYLHQKPCGGSKSFNKAPEDVETLSSSTVAKSYMILNSALPTALEWGYITKLPKLKGPSVKSEKRKFWSPETVLSSLERMDGSEDDGFLHLCVHLAFIGSLREGEAAGILIKDINMKNNSVNIHQEIQRCSDAALKELLKKGVVFVFPKQREESKSSMVAKDLKTEKSERTAYLTRQLMEEIRKRIERIKKDKAYYGDKYNDYGLLLCLPNGNPIEPINMGRRFKKWQEQNEIPKDNQIDFQGLRKSGQMHKIRLSQFNYQLVASLGGHSPAVLMKNYDEALETEKRSLASKIETNFYTLQDNAQSSREVSIEDDKAQELARQMTQNPQLLQQAMQIFLASAQSAQGSQTSRY
jgi:integrase